MLRSAELGWAGAAAGRHTHTRTHVTVRLPGDTGAGALSLARQQRPLPNGASTPRRARRRGTRFGRGRQASEARI